MAKQPDLIRCIYCGEISPPSVEHVVPRALGGELTIRDVCQGCNTQLGTIDQRLAEFSIFTLNRVGNADPAQFPAYMGGDHFRLTPEGLWAEVRIANRLQAVLLPQIVLGPPKVDGQQEMSTIGGDADGLRELIKLIAARIAAGTLHTIHIKEGPETQAKTPRILLHRKKDLIVRALNQEAASQFLQTLERNWTFIEKNFQGASLTPSQKTSGVVQLTMRVSPDDNLRAVAKIAYGLLCHCKGPGFVLRPEFTPLREYIRGNDIRHEIPAPTANDVPVDSRFVRWLHGQTKGFLPTEGHSVLIAHVGGWIVASVTLYKDFTFAVRMAEIALPGFQVEGFEFFTDRSPHQRLDLLGIVQRLQEDKPCPKSDPRHPPWRVLTT